MSTSFVTASNRKRIIIGVSVVFVCLLFISFQPRESSTWRSWTPSSTSPFITGSDPKSHPAGSVEGYRPQPSQSSSKPGTPGGIEHEAGSRPSQAHPSQQEQGSSKTTAAGRPVSTSARITTDEVCSTHAKTDDVLVVMKTGATEAYDKLPIHFLTTLRCANDTILFSDMEMEMGGHHIIDALADIDPAIMEQNSNDFKLYNLLKEYHELYEDPRTLKNGGNGWNLDKFKFNQMMLKTWEYRQDPAWYVFIEADTYLVWDNLRTLLAKYDPDQPYYIGSPTYLDIEFAHGGTGYVISRGAMKKGVGQHPDVADRYDKDVGGTCCGDRFPARILLDEGIKLTKAWPMFNGEKPLTLPYSKSHWCQPLITMHHMTAQEVSQVWTFEQQRKAQGIKEPMMIKDIYNHFVKANLDNLNPPVRENWENLASDKLYKPISALKNDGTANDGKDFQALPDIKRLSVENPENCQKLCDSESECMNWMHKGKECHLGKSIKIGAHHSPDGNDPFTSGWNMKVIKKFLADMGDCPNGPDWTVRGV